MNAVKTIAGAFVGITAGVVLACLLAGPLCNWLNIPMREGAQGLFFVSLLLPGLSLAGGVVGALVGSRIRGRRAAIAEFGVAVPGINYILRHGGYAVIFNQAGEVATVSTPTAWVLPGGGQEPGESPDTAAFRESKEECGLDIVVGDFLGIADELVYAADEQKHYRKRCSFYLAKASAASGTGEPDHQLIWLPPREAESRLQHESQRWAVAEARRFM